MTADVLEQERGAALFGDAIGDLGYFKLRVHLGPNAFELISLFEKGYELSEVFEWHRLAQRRRLEVQSVPRKVNENNSVDATRRLTYITRRLLRSAIDSIRVSGDDHVFFFQSHQDDFHAPDLRSDDLCRVYPGVPAATSHCHSRN